MSMDFTLDTKAITAKLGKFTDGIIPVIRQAMNEEAEITMTRSKEDYVPVDTGNLRSSGQVETEIQGESVTTQLGFGGAAADYAIYVHEINKNYRNGKQWKYLETPLKEDLPRINDGIAKAVEDFIGGA